MELVKYDDPVQQGRDAWNRIKESDKRMREDWLVVGTALDVGRQLCIAESGGLNKKAFGQWCEKEGFSDLVASVRTDALWLLDEWESIRLSSSITYNNPTAIRQQYRALVLLHTGDEESYTPVKYIESARRVMGEINLDPASNEMAQRTVNAGQYFSSDDDGLTKMWCGKVWMNPPYTARVINLFIEKIILHYLVGDISEAIVLTNNNTDTSWFHIAAKESTAICFTEGRINFDKSDGSQSSPTNGQSFFYFGDNKNLFTSEFSNHGLVMVKA